MPLVLPPTSFLDSEASPIPVRYSKSARARLQTYAAVKGVTMSTLVRSLVKIGWAVINEGSDLDMPLGTSIKLAQGIAGAGGASELFDALMASDSPS
jgi:hypothetical protein